MGPKPESLWRTSDCAVEQDKRMVIAEKGEYWVLTSVEELELLNCTYKRSGQVGLQDGSRFFSFAWCTNA